MNPDPEMERMKFGAPAVTVAGDSAEITGAGFTTAKEIGFDIPLEFCTLIESVVAVVSNCAGIVAVSVVADTKVPANVYPLIDTKELEVNSLPVIVITVSGEPTIAEAGATDVNAGAGGLTTEKALAFDVPPPGAGLVTVMFVVPKVARSVAVSATVSCVVL
jgi:hypothetical protein